MKVRTIINIRNDLFDDEINDFIQHKHVIDIKFNLCLDSHGRNIYNALIMYEDL